MSIEHMATGTNLFALGIELDDERQVNARALRERVYAAENAGFTFATFDDSLSPPANAAAGRIDSTTRAAFVAATTSTLGLVPVVAPTYAEPFHLSSQLATLDYASRGRAGWLAVDDPGTAHAWGAQPRVTEDEIRRERVDSVEVAQRLWDSWEDDAVIRDYASGKFLDRGKLHYADFIGAAFSVKGPSIVPRPPQGQVVVFTYDTTGSDNADVALVAVRTTANDQVPHPTVADTLAAVTRARDAGFARVLADLAVELDAGNATPDLITRLTALSEHADGVRLRLSNIDEELPILAHYVLPALLRAGIAHRPVPGSTLRANLGLPRPVNRYAKELTR